MPCSALPLPLAEQSDQGRAVTTPLRSVSGALVSEGLLAVRLSRVGLRPALPSHFNALSLVSS